MFKFWNTFVEYLVNKSICEMSVLVEYEHLDDVVDLVGPFKVNKVKFTEAAGRSMYNIYKFEASNEKIDVIADELENKFNMEWIRYNGRNVICIVSGERVAA